MTEWNRLTGEPSAPMIGPFPRAPFLQTWQQHRGAGDVTIVGGPDSVAAIVVDGVGRFAGESHLTDYHSPLGSDPAALAGTLVSLDVALVLDSIPVEVADPLEKGLADAGVDVARVPGEPCMVIDLAVPGDDGWEATLDSKQRHELRRKRRRFAEALGEPVLVDDHEAFGRFVDLHRASDGKKGDFMTDDMAGFFEGLLGIDGARLDVLQAGDGRVVAAAFGFEDDDAYYLYNSAFDPQEARVSPGILLIDELIRSESEAGRTRFDFLKGAETYKRRLGAVERALFTLEVRL